MALSKRPSEHLEAARCASASKSHSSWHATLKRWRNRRQCTKVARLPLPRAPTGKNVLRHASPQPVERAKYPKKASKVRDWSRK
eukprot:6937681-Alexandrium_andersonii.AAC.1